MNYPGAQPRSGDIVAIVVDGVGKGAANGSQGSPAGRHGQERD
ncbi:MAG: hypothetical protein ACYC35_15125 [Pirellulales bacterium]